MQPAFIRQCMQLGLFSLCRCVQIYVALDSGFISVHCFWSFTRSNTCGLYIAHNKLYTGCKENHFYSLLFGQAEATQY